MSCVNDFIFYRLVPPIPVLTRILPKNITLDRYKFVNIYNNYLLNLTFFSYGGFSVQAIPSS